MTGIYTKFYIHKNQHPNVAIFQRKKKLFSFTFWELISNSVQTIVLIGLLKSPTMDQQPPKDLRPILCDSVTIPIRNFFRSSTIFFSSKKVFFQVAPKKPSKFTKNAAFRKKIVCWFKNKNSTRISNLILNVTPRTIWDRRLILKTFGIKNVFSRSYKDVGLVLHQISHTQESTSKYSDFATKKQLFFLSFWELISNSVKTIVLIGPLKPKNGPRGSKRLQTNTMRFCDNSYSKFFLIIGNFFFF